MAKKFKIGDKVRINRFSKYHNLNPDGDPHYTVTGVVEKYCDGPHKYVVRWPSGQTNNYADKDLVGV